MEAGQSFSGIPLKAKWLEMKVVDNKIIGTFLLQPIRIVETGKVEVFRLLWLGDV